MKNNDFTDVYWIDIDDLDNELDKLEKQGNLWVTHQFFSKKALKDLSQLRKKLNKKDYNQLKK